MEEKIRTSMKGSFLLADTLLPSSLHNESTMKSLTFLFVLVVALLGVAMAFLQPKKPVQVEAVVDAPSFLLDNDFVPSDPAIHPARKCK